MIEIFTTETCPVCSTIKKLMDKNDIKYEVKDMNTPVAKTELAMKGLFPMSAPVMFIGGKIYESEELSGMLPEYLLELLKPGN